MTGNEVLDLLDYRLRSFLQNTLGWKELSEIQNKSIPTISDNEDSLIIAPTASGKTEAVLIPLYNKLLTQHLTATSILYIAPLKALINDMDKRLYNWNKHFGYSATKWHGDVSQSLKSKYIRNPTDILLTTPESLEVLLINKNESQKKKIFENIKYIIIDEIHYFVESERGIQLNSLLKRLSEYCENPTKIGLSATVGNPDTVAKWLNHKKPATIIKTSQKPNIKYKVQYYQQPPEIPEYLEKYKDNKVLLFCHSRENVEKYNKMIMDNIDTNVYLHHSSISKEIRERNEDLFKTKENAFMVNTSTLELGIDIGNIDLVSMITPPATMNSFLQKIGRSGRKTKIERALLFTSDNENSLYYLAQMNLSYNNMVEEIHIRRQPLDIYLHQILSIIFQKTEVKIPEPYYLLNDTYVFKDISKDTYKHLIKHLVDSKILDLLNGKLSLGYEFEKLFGNVNFLDFYSVFQTNVMYKIIFGKEEIGQLDLSYTFELATGQKFLLGGQYWQINEIDYTSLKIYVKKTGKTNNIPKWGSGINQYSYLINRQIYKIFLNQYDNSLLSLFNNEFQLYLTNLIEYTAEFNIDEKIIPVNYYFKGNIQKIKIYTFAGHKVNYLLSNILIGTFNIKDVNIKDFSIELTSDDDIADDLIRYYNEMTNDDINDEIEIYLNGVELEHHQTKFSHYLPEEQQEEVIKELIFNFDDLNDLKSKTKMELFETLNYDEILKNTYQNYPENKIEESSSFNRIGQNYDNITVEDNKERLNYEDINPNTDTVIEYIDDKKLHLYNEDSTINKDDIIDSLKTHSNFIHRNNTNNPLDSIDNVDLQRFYNSNHPEVNLFVQDDTRVDEVITDVIRGISSAHINQTFTNTQKDRNEDFNHLEEQRGHEDKVFINSADEEQLSKLPGFHLIHVKKLIKLRQNNIYMNSFNDLVEQIGIDSEYLDQLNGIIIFDKVTNNNVKENKNKIKAHKNRGRRIDL